MLSNGQLNRATLARQLLLARAGDGSGSDLGPVLGGLGGLQAQEPRPPHVALWSRLRGYDPAQLNAALADRRAIRAPLMRATLHTVCTADYLSWRGPLDPVLRGALSALRGRDEGLDLDATVAAARELLADGPLTFNEIRAALQARFPGVDDRALGYATRMVLPLAMVPGDDRWGFPRDARFTPADGWLGEEVGAGGAEALIRSYLLAFGPASVADFQKWSGLTGMRAAVEAVADLVTYEDQRGRTLYDLPGLPIPDAETPAPPRLLPEFDQLVLAHDDRSRVVPDAFRAQIVTKNLRVQATFLLDGVVAGLWTFKATRTRATLTLQPFARLAAKLPELDHEAEELARFLEPDARSYEVTRAAP